MSIWKNLGRVIARALRAAGRALRRLARRGKDAASTAAEVAEDAYEISLDVTHDMLDVAEHVASVPGAILGGLLGARPEQPGDVADAAIAADAAPVKAAPSAAASATVREKHLTERVLDYAQGRCTAKEARLTEAQRLWLDDMAEDERAGLARFSQPQLMDHLMKRNYIPGIQPPYDKEMVKARYAELGMPLEVALRELRLEAQMQGTANWERARGNAKGAAWIEEAMRKGSMRPRPPVPAEAMHEAPAMRMWRLSCHTPTIGVR